MVSYRMMDRSCLLTTCLHKGPIPLAQCEAPESSCAYIETVADIRKGSIARILKDLSERYGACGVIAIADGMVVGKIRCYPQVLCDLAGYPCLQVEESCQTLLRLDIASLTSQEQSPVLRIGCIQVANLYEGHGIAGVMLNTLIEWARVSGWKTIVASALPQIPPLLSWSGMQGYISLQNRGFVAVSQKVSSEICEAVIHMRQGGHGPDIQKQWEAYAGLSDYEAATLFEMRLDF